MLRRIKYDAPFFLFYLVDKLNLFVPKPDHMINHILLIFYIAFLFIAISLKGQSELSKLDKYFLKKMQKTNIIGIQVGFLTAANEAWIRSYGIKDNESGKEVNDSTLFMIASCSKPVTALALMKLAEQGRIKLDENINFYLPFEVKNPFYPEDQISVRMLLSHTSSLNDNWDIMEPLYTIEEGGDSPIQLADYMKDYYTPEGWYYDSTLNFFKAKPGTYWSYCNMGYTLAGYIIEEVSGMSFSEYMNKEIFTPLGMNNSYWFLKEIPHKNIARPHELPPKNSVDSAIKMLPHYGYPDFPDGQLRTTTYDYSRFLSVFLNEGMIDGNRFLNKETIDEFLKVQFPEVNKWQAVAWNYNEFESKLYYLFMPRLPSHTGGDPGVATVVSFDPEKKVGAIVFVNSPPNTFKGGKIFYLDMVKRLLKEAAKK